MAFFQYPTHIYTYLHIFAYFYIYLHIFTCYTHRVARLRLLQLCMSPLATLPPTCYTLGQIFRPYSGRRDHQCHQQRTAGYHNSPYKPHLCTSSSPQPLAKYSYVVQTFPPNSILKLRQSHLHVSWAKRVFCAIFRSVTTNWEPAIKIERTSLIFRCNSLPIAVARFFSIINQLVL